MVALADPKLAVAAVACLACLCAGSAGSGQSPWLLQSDRPPDWVFLSWEGRAQHREGTGLRITAADGRGGAGFHTRVDASAAAGGVSHLVVTLGPGHLGKAIRVTVGDADGTRHEFRFALDGLVPGVRASVPALGLGSLHDPDRVAEPGVEPGLDAAAVAHVILQGDWSDGRLDLTVFGLELVAPDAQAMAAREARRARIAAAAEARRAAQEEQRRRREERLADPQHPADGAAVIAVGAVARDILAITLQDGTPVVPGITPYEPLPDDERRPKGKSKWDWDPARNAFVEVSEVEVFRRLDGTRRLLGTLSPDGRSILPPLQVEGTPLEAALLEDPLAYAVISPNDPAYAAAVAPAAVQRKSKPTGSLAGGRQPLRHHLYLRLPTALRDGADYTVKLDGLNGREASVSHRHVSTAARSEAVQAIQTGYRADDPHKRAVLAIWLGTGGGYQHEGVDRFELLDDASGAVVFAGVPRLAKALGAAEALKEDRDYARTAVWSLDFGAFARLGRYRVHVPGVGCSLPFEIADDVWLRAFRTAMQGFVHQRNGIALEAPWAGFVRPRPLHPDDGVRFLQMGVQLADGQEGVRGQNLLDLSRAGGLVDVDGVWGGYQDAGDWDSLGSHLAATQLLLELADLFPGFAAATRLSLPPAESANPIPDILDEALWNLSSFRRLQLPDGAVRGGYGPGWGARDASTSDSVRVVGVYAPDVLTGFRYAGCAAVAARLLVHCDAADAERYGASAVRAWAWSVGQTVPGGKAGADVARWRAYAAVELFRLTGDTAYHKAFIEVTELRGPGPFVEQPEASFAYARLPAELADGVLQAAAVGLFRAAAERAIAFAARNGYGVITDRTDLPVISYVGYFSTPGMASQNLPRAHYLTGDPRHLAAVVQACTYSLGANPEGRTFTVGLGQDWPRHPLHLDSRRSGQSAPRGITIYGAGDEASEMSRKWNSWVHQWHAVGMVPHPHAWPAQESNLDIFVSPSLCEYTVHQQLGPMAYHLGYLAARP